jgi:hypothetical protein
MSAFASHFRMALAPLHADLSSSLADVRGQRAPIGNFLVNLLTFLLKSAYNWVYVPVPMRFAKSFDLRLHTKPLYTNAAEVELQETIFRGGYFAVVRRNMCFSPGKYLQGLT